MARRDFEKQDKRNKLLMALFIIAIMILSSAAFVINYYATSNDSSNKIEYNGYKFEITANGIYQTEYQGQIIQLYNNPRDLELINIDNINLNADRIYLAYNTTQNDQSILIDLNRLKYVFAIKGIISNPSCIEDKDCPDLPIVDCKSNDNIIYFKNSYIQNYNINKQNSCNIIEADTLTMNKITDKIVLRVLGIA